MPAEQVAVPEALPLMVMVALSPDSTPQVPPMLVMSAWVAYGKVTAEPFTLVIVTTGAVRSSVKVMAVPEK